MLNFAGYQVINLKSAKVAFPTFKNLAKRFNPVKPTDVILFYRQVALLIESGLNIVGAIELLGEQATNTTFRKVLEEIVSDIQGGSQLSAALNKHPQVFSPVHCQSLKVGEQTGGLETILRQIADHMEKQVNSRKGVKNAMTYPVLAVIVAVVVVAVMVVFVLPSFNELYVSLGVELPLLTRMMLSAGELLRSIGGYLILCLLAAIVIGYWYIKTPQGRYKWDKLSLYFPLVGCVNHLNELARISSNISILFKAGLPLTEVLPLIIQGTGNKYLIEALIKVREDMLGGEGLSRPMSKHPVFLPMMVQMVRVGEETGNLDQTLNSVAKNYEAEAEDKVKSLIALIQPVMTVVIGLVVGIMALSLVSAMYSMFGQTM